MHKEEKEKDPPKLVGAGALPEPGGKGTGLVALPAHSASSRSWPTASAGRKGFCHQHKAEFSWQEGMNKSSQKVHEDFNFPLKKKKKKEQEKDFLEMN